MNLTDILLEFSKLNKKKNKKNFYNFNKGTKKKLEGSGTKRGDISADVINDIHLEI